jgi:protein TonB
VTRSALGGSACVHLTLLTVLFAMQSHAPRLMIGPDVIQLALLEPTPTAARPAAAVMPPAPARAPELHPEEGTGVKIAPVKPKPAKRTPPPSKAEPAPTLALPSAPLGRAGLSGDVSVDAGDFEFSYYLLLLRNRIAQNWTPPAGLVASGAPIRAVVYFRVDHEGGVRDARLESASSVEFFDRSALRAVVLSDPLPPLPAGYPGASLGVHFGFEYTTP